LVELKATDFSPNGVFIGEDKFATRYFLTTNGLPLKKGEYYVQWNLFGPDFQFSIGENFGIGVMTTWVGVPMIGTVKKSWQLGEKTQIAAGALLGTGTWILPSFGGVLPFGTLSYGTRKANMAISSGYGAIWQDGNAEGRALLSIAGMIKVSTKISLVFDSFILLPSKGKNLNNPNSVNYRPSRNAFALIIPGVRWHTDEDRAFQFGFTGIVADGSIVPLPIPTLQWYRSF